MTLPGQTSLDALTEIPPEVQANLRDLWIDSVEEYVALLSVVDRRQAAGGLGVAPEGLDSSIRRASALVSPARLTSLTTPRAGGGLGFRIDPEIIDAFRAQGIARRVRHPFPSRTLVTTSVAMRHGDKMFPVRDQGERGTCVAFAAVALREFLLGKAERLSEQFLYWASKEVDGSPEPGTYIHTAMTALRKWGVCRADTWPYKPDPIPGNESQGPPPEDATEEAMRFKMPNTRTVEPSLVDDYKEILAGSKTAAGMPVVVATLVFDSWYRSSESHRTGKITMPLPGEQPLPTGHAWCIVGYVDDTKVPGGGYFIVRNSWGEQWASDSPEAPGHALMPYAYIERCAVEAFAGEALPMSAEAKSADPFARDYVRPLSRETRDMDSRLLKSGTRVIVNPAASAEVREYTEKNKQRFLEQGCFWTKESRIRDWMKRHPFPEPNDPVVQSHETAASDFFSAVDENLHAAVGSVFPDNNLPWWVSLLPWQPRVRRLTPVAGEHGRKLTKRLCAAMGIPDFIQSPVETMEIVPGPNQLRIYEISSFPMVARVVVAWITPWHIDASGNWQVGSLAQGHVDAIMRSVESTQRDGGTAPAVFTYYSIGTSGPWSAEMKGGSAGQHLMVLSSARNDGGWDMHIPPRFSNKTAIRDFLDVLRPETRLQRISRIKSHVDDLIGSGFQGTISIERIKEATSDRRASIRDAFLAMQDSGHYRLFRERGVLRIEPAQPGQGVQITSRQFRRSFVRKHGLMFVSAAVGASAWMLRGMLRIGGWSGFLALVVLVYASGLMQISLNRSANAEE